MHFPCGDAHPPCHSQASLPQILQNTDINRLITRVGSERRYIQCGSRRRQGVRKGAGKREEKGKGRGTVGSRWKFGDTPGASTTLQSAHASRCIASFGRPNVSDDVTDITNCKNYHRGTSPAVSRTGLFNPCASPGFEFDTIASNLDVSFNAKPQRQRCCYHSSMRAEFRQNFSNIHPHTRTHTYMYIYTHVHIYI